MYKKLFLFLEKDLKAAQRVAETLKAYFLGKVHS
jgi:hypothetical protein